MNNRTPPSHGEFESPASKSLVRASARVTRVRWYGVAVLAAIVGGIVTWWTYRETGAYYPFFSGLALIAALGGGFGPAIVASMGSVILSHVLPPAGSMIPAAQGELVRLLANVVLLLGVCVLAGLIRRSRIAMFNREARLESAAARTREMLDELSDAIVLTDSSLRITYVNARAVAMFGYPLDTVVGRSVSDIVTPESINQLPLQINALQTGRTIRTERTAFRADGAIIEVDVAARFLSDGRMLASVRDTTERKQELERQRAERDLLDGILATSVAGVVVANLDGKIIFANRRAERLLELRKSNPETRQYDVPEWRQAALDGGPWPSDAQPFNRVVASDAAEFDMRVAIVWNDGRRLVLSINGAPLKSGDGELEAVVFAVNDITDALAAEQRLRERDRQLAEITQAIPGLVFQYVVGADGTERFVYVSGYAERLLADIQVDLSADPSTGWAMIHADDLARTRASVQASFQSMRPWVHEFRTRDFQKRGGNRWVSGRAIPQPGPEPGSVLWNGILLDITSRKLLEDELHQTQRIESIGRLAGGIAHDFNNLLTVILGQSELLRLDLPADSELSESIEQIKLAAQSGSSLTRRLLGFARRQVVAPQVVDVNSLALRMPPLVGRLLGERVTLSLHLADVSPRVRVDPVQVEQVLMNLVVNARDAMPNGGALDIHTQRVAVDHAMASAHPSLSPGAYAEIRVVDTGTGMNDVVLRQAFEPFFSTKQVGKGTGLGLATSYGIVRQSGGTMLIDSSVGHGTTVRVLLPETLDAVDAIARETALADDRGHETVLVVDDDESVLHVTAVVLRRHGYRVIEALGPPKALEAARHEVGPIHLLVTDVVMPGMNGSELADVLLRDRPDLRVLYVTGYADGALSKHGKLAEDVTMLQKPYDIGELAKRVRAILGPADATSTHSP